MNPIQQSIQMALSNAVDEAPLEEPSATATNSELPNQIDLKGAINGLKISIPLVSASLWSSNDAKEEFINLLGVVQTLAGAILPSKLESDIEKNNATIIRSVILRCVEQAALRDKLDILTPELFLRLFEKSSYISGFDVHTPSNNTEVFETNLLILIGFNISPIGLEQSEVQKHLARICGHVDTLFSTFANHNIKKTTLQQLKILLLPEMSQLHMRLVEIEIKHIRAAKLAGESASFAALNIEKSFYTQLKSIIDATIANTRVKK